MYVDSKLHDNRLRRVALTVGQTDIHTDTDEMPNAQLKHIATSLSQ